ncbi:hypothetical protein COO60DRAFT_1463835 [Scenedesmus sp. NREL 46B-D3]|nr:hypothetical protein COO60DRAFT_1463835 [Scenedesmus sp. NREL 46B-D3]
MTGSEYSNASKQASSALNTSLAEYVSRQQRSLYARTMHAAWTVSLSAGGSSLILVLARVNMTCAHLSTSGLMGCGTWMYLVPYAVLTGIAEALVLGIGEESFTGAFIVESATDDGHSNVLVVIMHSVSGTDLSGIQSALRRSLDSFMKGKDARGTRGSSSSRGRAKRAFAQLAEPTGLDAVKRIRLLEDKLAALSLQALEHHGGGLIAMPTIQEVVVYQTPEPPANHNNNQAMTGGKGALGQYQFQVMGNSGQASLPPPAAAAGTNNEQVLGNNEPAAAAGSPTVNNKQVDEHIVIVPPAAAAPATTAGGGVITIQVPVPAGGVAAAFYLQAAMSLEIPERMLSLGMLSPLFTPLHLTTSMCNELGGLLDV